MTTQVTAKELLINITTSRRPMPSPSKRQKNSNRPVQPGKTLDFFFGKERQQSAPKTPACEPAAEGLTDEEYAKKLAAEWEKEDQAHTNQPSAAGIGSSAGNGTRKRPRSSSPQGQVDNRDGHIEESIALPDSAQNRQTTPQRESKDDGGGIPTAPLETPHKKAVTLEVEDELNKTIEAIPFDQDPQSFDPDSYERLPKLFPDEKATYGLLTRTFVLVNSTRSRIKIVDTITNFLRLMIRLDPDSLLSAVWLTTNDIGPPYESNELGIGSSIIQKAIAKTSGMSAAALRKLHHKYGDPGDVAFDAKVKQRTLMMKKPTPLTIRNVYTTLLKIAKSSGKGSQEIKQRHVERMLVDAKGEEIRYLTRTLIQHLRIGAVKTTMLIALSRAFTMSRPKEAPWATPAIPNSKEERQELFLRKEEIMKQCFSRRPNYNDLIPVLLSGGIDALEEQCGMAMHVPLKPMLGSITRDLSEMLEKLQGRDFSCEYKYDGQRAQVHCDNNGKVTIFSRHLENMTSKYPDLVDLVPKIRGEGVGSFIMEGEVVAVDSETGALKTFQTLAGRERKDVAIGGISVQVCLFAFDLMYLNDQELLSTPFSERRELLRTKFVEIQKRFLWVRSLDATSTDTEQIRDFFRSALEAKCEGIMVKVLHNGEPITLTADEESTASEKKKSRRKPLLATYRPDQRVESWLKVKKDYDSAADTLDLVPIGGWHGMGRKAKWWSPILLAVRNPDTGSLEAVCKCMSGFTDKTYAEMKEFYDEDGVNTSKTPKGYIESALTPTVWFEPKEVWEVAFADITLSPTYTAALGLVSDERGLSLRFPRYLRKREDKSIEEASTSQLLADLYFKQEDGGKGSRATVVEDGAVQDEVDEVDDETSRMFSEEAEDGED